MEFTKQTNWDKLFDLKNSKEWKEMKVYAKTTKEVVMQVWNGKHPVDENTSNHNCKAGTKVLVWMVSRMGDVGITDNLVDARGYSARVDPDKYLTDYEFIYIK